MSESLPVFSELFPGRDIRREWDDRPGHHDLPPISPIRRVPVDLERLRAFFLSYRQTEESFYEKQVVQNVDRIPEGYVERYYTGILSHPTREAAICQSRADSARGMHWTEHQKNLSKKQLLASLKLLNENYDPLVDERNYTRLDEGAAGSYIDELRTMFRGRITRMRFGKLNPGEGVRPHRDVVPNYGCRIHIPLWSNPLSYSFGLKGEKLHHYHLAEGRAYLLNGGIVHWAHNFGETPRIHLVMSVDGTEDYEGDCEGP